MNMQYGKDGLRLTKHFEGCSLKAYRDGGGVLTNGYGNTHRVIEGSTITLEQAESDLLANVADAVDAVNDHVTVTITQDQFDSLVDLVFNIGTTAFKNSTLLRKLNAGDFEGAGNQFVRWNQDNGKVIAGLTRRREAEAALFRNAT
jgi:lysozyme